MKKLFTLLLLAAGMQCFAQKPDKLTLEGIMRDPKWIGTSPANVQWSDDSRKIYFNWDPENTGRPALYSVTPGSLKPQKASIDERKAMIPSEGSWDMKHIQKVFEKNGDIFMYDGKAGKQLQLTATTEPENNPVFSDDGARVIFKRGDNLYAMSINGGITVQLTNFVHAAETPDNKGGALTGTPQDQWLRNEQTELFDVIKKRAQTEKQDAADRSEITPEPRKKISIAQGKTLNNLQASPNLHYVSYNITLTAKNVKKAVVPNYVTASGYTEDILNRTKVGTPLATSMTFVYDTERDTAYKINTANLPGIKDIPAYMQDYPERQQALKALNADRAVTVDALLWSDDSKTAVVIISAQDNKDRWIAKLNPATGVLNVLDRQHDDAWVAGPGISDSDAGNVGWIDRRHFYFQSEVSGYSHVYVVDVNTAEKKQITSGKWEVQTLQLSQNKQTFYFTANMDHPGVSDFYRVPVTGGVPVKLTSMKGGNEIALSPDEKWLAIRYSYISKPYELYLQPNKPGAKAVQVTNSVSDEFKSHDWRAPEVFTFKNRYGTEIYGRVYLPKNPAPSHPAIVFVHGAGYLQDVMYKWSTAYTHEYLFNNLLADEGYTVLEIDYTGSAGYGRDIRTGIYRHMGGKDLTDHLDAVKLLTEKYGVNPKNVGIYGGSYGGFMTLMAMFTSPGTFAAGAALRSVTDWAHYNHGYTSNILNQPYDDPKAYQQSSPINFADGLKGRLLMCHGMVDLNVNFQDIVRLTQKLIELHKDNWQLAPYPVEDHTFVEASSWLDEYKRIYTLFNETLLKQ
ncbi:dipeptidyl aminopeptidase/acylaminoacyl peptidase [Mucilaginibacter yixingensis]|uniref:Dipeptidyl aminopeptidase/acylaminoacyl peptidase n=1 Tax=Mucilaginibacter yixingensis TaxID=1295612 RepID=A0A2T5JDF0_9SPHI|nr:prolyl oligopeptidase family serine peptidase [Mucilaginibacter yixingensis]PTQ99801.1 dipeptidyl aminopeptidase/acylaminoacyl peptidase [Mucilaginibacter yixingensis]